jgi:hypothetical protein
MKQSVARSAESPQGAKSPRRDWLLLSLLSLITICILCASTELLARRMFASKGSVNDCMVMNDPSTGIRAIPNSVCWEKSPEGPLVEYRFNDCGDRTDVECGRKPKGSYRIVIAGSSIPMGARVPAEKTFASLLPAELSRQTGREIEIYNAAVYRERPPALALRFKEILAQQPDLILWVITPMDIQEVSDSMPAQGPQKSGEGFLEKSLNRAKEGIASGRFADAAGDIWSYSKSAMMLRHFLYSSQSRYTQSLVMGGDYETGYLKAHPSAAWQDRMRQLDIYAAEIEAEAKSAGVPFAAVLLPNRAEAAMLSMNRRPAQFNPYELDDELCAMVTSHGGIYLDILPRFHRLLNTDRFFYPVDVHPNADGQAAFAELLDKELTGGAIPALKSKGTTQVPSTLER